MHDQTKFTLEHWRSRPSLVRLLCLCPSVSNFAWGVNKQADGSAGARYFYAWMKSRLICVEAQGGWRQHNCTRLHCQWESVVSPWLYASTPLKSRLASLDLLTPILASHVYRFCFSQSRMRQIPAFLPNLWITNWCTFIYPCFWVILIIAFIASLFITLFNRLPQKEADVLTQIYKTHPNCTKYSKKYRQQAANIAM